MEKVFIEPTRTTPLIKFDPDEGVLEMRGRSSPENSIQFYQKVLDNLDEYAISGGQEFTANIAFEYFNTSSSKCILDVFKKLEKINSDNNGVTINWHYEEDDEDMLEAGEDYQAIINIPFKMVEIEE